MLLREDLDTEEWGRAFAAGKNLNANWNYDVASAKQTNSNWGPGANITRFIHIPIRRHQTNPTPPDKGRQQFSDQSDAAGPVRPYCSRLIIPRSSVQSPTGPTFIPTSNTLQRCAPRKVVNVNART